jgi:hypothetical protein
MKNPDYALMFIGYFFAGLCAAAPAALLAHGLFGGERVADAVFGGVWLAGIIIGAVKARVLP